MTRVKAEPLPTLLDTGGLMRELGVKRHAAEAIMRALPKVEVPGLRKGYVKRADVAAFIDENTRAA